jgi:hypothetical protein
MTITHYDAEDARRTEVTAGTIWFLTVDAAPAAARTTEHGGGVRILPVVGSDRQRIARLASRLNRLFSTERFGVARVNDWIMD